MAKPKNARVYIKEENDRYDFLWGDGGDDGSVYFGLTGKGRQTVRQIEAGRDYVQKVSQKIFHPYTGPHKISFHVSGQYTLANHVEDGVDKNRLVAHGKPLLSISQPTRMMDIIVPTSQLKLTNKKLPESYIDLPADLQNNSHLCCTVFCMPENELLEFGENCTSIIRGSTWESKNAFASGRNAWAFILHNAVDESTKKDYSLISINGCGVESLIDE